MPVEPPAAVPIPSDALLVRAARGDADAQAQLSDQCLDCAVAGEMTLSEGVGAAELWARMAATHGNPQHMLLLTGILLVRSAFISEGMILGTEADATHLHGEAVSLLSGCADHGSEEAAEFLNLVVEHAGPDVLNVAKAIRAAAEKKPPEQDGAQSA